MKTIYSKILLTLVLTSIIGLSACDKEDDSLTPEQQRVKQLVATWQATQVNLNDAEVGGYNDFQITFTGVLAYSTSGGPDKLPFPSSGSWELGSDINTSLIIDAGNTNLAAQYELADNSVIIEFTYTGDGFPNARVNGLTGSWRFEFVKN
jgi:hypothetical protein